MDITHVDGEIDQNNAIEQVLLGWFCTPIAPMPSADQHLSISSLLVGLYSDVHEIAFIVL